MGQKEQATSHNKKPKAPEEPLPPCAPVPCHEPGGGFPTQFARLFFGVITVLVLYYTYAIIKPYLVDIFLALAIFFTAGFNNTPFYPSSFDLNSSLSIYNASSSRYTLTAMSYIALAVPFVLGYIAYFWHLMDREKLSTGEVSDFNAKEMY